MTFEPLQGFQRETKGNVEDANDFGVGHRKPPRFFRGRRCQETVSHGKTSRPAVKGVKPIVPNQNLVVSLASVTVSYWKIAIVKGSKCSISTRIGRGRG